MLHHVHITSAPPSIAITENGCDAPGEDAAPWPALLNDTFRVAYFEAHVEVGDVVRVSNGGTSLPCLVERQFKVLKAGASVNRIVAHVLGLVARVEASGDPEDTTSGEATQLGTMITVSSLL